jgi:NADH:ubiquinone oxidoreductase subunit 5 (subunit L)/multisubunit Na+/H+ antiporter MnhA subunit
LKFTTSRNKLKIPYILCFNEMSLARGQGDPAGVIITTIIVAIIAILGIQLLSGFSQNITITGSLAETGENLLAGTANALVLAVGGTGIAVTAILILRGGGR